MTEQIWTVAEDPDSTEIYRIEPDIADNLTKPAADRIVACVNVLSGLTNEQLEENDFKSLIEDWKRLANMEKT
jgi:hypothetical protein